MEITETKAADVMTIALKGRLDAATSKTTEDRILKTIESGERRLVLDLGGLSYVSSVGLRVLMVTAKRMKSVQGKLAVCSLQPSVKEVFEIAGFLTIFRVFETCAQASKEL